MPNFDLQTFDDIIQAILRRVKGDSEDSLTTDKVKEFINTRYRKISSMKKWKWLRVTDRSLRLLKFVSTGTATFTSGSRQVVGVGTPWSGSNRNWWIKPDGVPDAYRVITVLSATQLVMSSPFVGQTLAGAGYKLFQSELALFPNLEDIDDVRIDGKPWRMEPKGPAVINRLRMRYPDFSGTARLYTIDGQALFEGPILQDFVLGYDFLGQGLTKAISLFPHIPDKDYTIQIPYKRTIDPLVNDTDEPLIPIEHRNVLLNLTLADWYSTNREDNTAAYYERLGNEGIKEMEARYLDTDDIIFFRTKTRQRYPHSRLIRHSQVYFDTEG